VELKYKLSAELTELPSKLNDEFITELKQGFMEVQLYV